MFMPSNETVEKWAKQLWKEHYEPLFFHGFAPSMKEKMPWYSILKWRIRIKLTDIRVALRIVFKGEYPDCDY